MRFGLFVFLLFFIQFECFGSDEESDHGMEIDIKEKVKFFETFLEDSKRVSSQTFTVGSKRSKTPIPSITDEHQQAYDERKKLEKKEKQVQKKVPFSEKYYELFEIFSNFVVLSDDFNEKLKTYKESGILLRETVPRKNEAFNYRLDTTAFYNINLASIKPVIESEIETLDHDTGPLDAKILSFIRIIQAVSEDQWAFHGWSLEMLKTDKLKSEAAVKATYMLVGKQHLFALTYNPFLKSLYVFFQKIFPYNIAFTEVDAVYHEETLSKLTEVCELLTIVHCNYRYKMMSPQKEIPPFYLNTFKKKSEMISSVVNGLCLSPRLKKIPCFKRDREHQRSLSSKIQQQNSPEESFEREPKTNDRSKRKKFNFKKRGK